MMVFGLEYYYMVILFPLVGFLLTMALSFIEARSGLRINSLLASCVVIFCTLSSFLLSFKLFIMACVGQSWSLTIKLTPWINIYSPFSDSFLVLNWGLLFDSLSITMLIVITSISVLVQIYSVSYMAQDVNRARFMGYLSLFVFFMLVLVTAPNYIQLFIGWEGVGLVSYLLINFWFTRVEAAKSALKAVVMNKIGDIALVLAMCLLFSTFHTLDYDVIFDNAALYAAETTEILIPMNTVTLIAFFLVLAAMGKSAQLGLHTWLPDAMEGPTPVSALIHAATMVTAGIYLVVRSSPILEQSPAALGFMAIVGALTALFGATTALFQSDLKKVIAYSTCSQLGYMFLSCGLSSYGLAMFHLFNHAFFKALLFLCAGSIIHAMGDEQDMRRMGGLVNLLPITYAAMMIGNLSLMGFPFLSGYFSKDLILETAATNFTAIGYFCYWLGLAAACFTALYSGRLVYLTFITKTNAHFAVLKKVHEGPMNMLQPLWILSLLSIFSGALFRDLFVGPFTTFWGQAIFVKPENLIFQADVHTLAPEYKVLPTVISLMSFLLIILFYVYLNKYSSWLCYRFAFFRALYLFFNKKWYFDVVYTVFFIKPMYLFAYNFVFKLVDRGLLHSVFLVAPINKLLAAGRLIKKLHSGRVYFYIFVALVAAVVVYFFSVK